MGKYSQPDAPDYRAAAEETAAGDKALLDEQTKANRPNQYNPWGQVEWSQDDQGNWSQNTTLNENSQGALDSQQKMQREKSDLASGMFGRMEGEFGEAMNWDQYGDQTGLEFDPSELRQKAEDASYNRATSRLDPRFEQEGEALEIKLRNRGLTEGDAAYDSAMQNFSMNKNDAYENAQNTAVGQGRGESAQDFSQQKGSADYANQLRQNSMKEEMQKRGFSLNEMNAIMSGQQVQAPNFEGFNQADRTQGADYTGAANSQSNFDQSQYQANMKGLTDIAGAGMGMFCDRRLKRDITLIGKFLGYPLYAFEYIWGDKAVGVMSDEVNPEAVQQHESGFDWVDYSKITQCKG